MTRKKVIYQRNMTTASEDHLRLTPSLLSPKQTNKKIPKTRKQNHNVRERVNKQHFMYEVPGCGLYRKFFEQAWS